MYPQHNRYKGWDLALTDEGWVMVEDIFGPSIIWQYASGKGIGLELEEMKCRLIKKLNESWGCDKRKPYRGY